MSKDFNSALDGADLGRSYDEVDIFGLDEFGDPTGLGAIYGAMVGTGVGTVTSIAVRSWWPEKTSYSELIGLGAGLLAGGVMAAFPETRHAGWVAMASAVLNNGLRAAEIQFRGLSIQSCPKDQHPDSSGKCVADTTTTQGHLGTYAIEPVQPMNGPSLGLYQAEALNGPGPGGVTLFGPPTQQTIAKHYGASYLNR